MGARRVQGDFKLTQGYTVATGQAVAVMDMVAYQSATVVRASDITWGTAVTAPSAPTVAASAATRGTALTNAATGVKVSANFPWGEGDLSSAGSATPTAAFGLKVTLAALPTNAISWNIYVEDSAGSGTYKLQQVTTVSAGIIYVDSYGTGRTPPTAVATDATAVTQYTFAQLFLGVSNQRMATTGFFGTPTRPFGNSSDNTIMICRGGVFEFDCASASFAAGAYVGAAKQSGNLLENQKVVTVAHPALAIGKVFKEATSVTKVMVEIQSRWLTPAPTPTLIW